MYGLAWTGSTSDISLSVVLFCIDTANSLKTHNEMKCLSGAIQSQKENHVPCR